MRFCRSAIPTVADRPRAVVGAHLTICPRADIRGARRQARPEWRSDVKRDTGERRAGRWIGRPTGGLGSVYCVFKPYPVRTHHAGSSAGPGPTLVKCGCPPCGRSLRLTLRRVHSFVPPRESGRPITFTAFQEGPRTHQAGMWLPGGMLENCTLVPRKPAMPK